MKIRTNEDRGVSGESAWVAVELRRGRYAIELILTAKLSMKRKEREEGKEKGSNQNVHARQSRREGYIEQKALSFHSLPSQSRINLTASRDGILEFRWRCSEERRGRRETTFGALLLYSRFARFSVVSKVRTAASRSWRDWM